MIKVVTFNLTTNRFALKTKRCDLSVSGCPRRGVSSQNIVENDAMIVDVLGADRNAFRKVQCSICHGTVVILANKHPN